MTVDPYSPCPCGSGKKIKFCCKDLAHEIDAVVRMVEGDQLEAARARVAKALRKNPLRATLLELKAMIELRQENLEEARKTIDEFLVAHPENPIAWANRAEYLSAADKDLEAVDALQRSLATLGSEMPQTVHTAILAVGVALVRSGQLMAARAHLSLYQGSAAPDDTQAAEVVFQLSRVDGMPLLLRDTYPLRGSQSDAAWATEFDEARLMARRGMWRAAEQKFATLLAASERAPEVLYNLAIVRGYMADRAGMIEGLDEYARCDVPRHDAVLALAVAQLHGEFDEESIDVVVKEFEVADADAVQERLIDAATCEAMTVRPFTVEDDEHLPGPILTRQLLESEWEHRGYDRQPIPNGVAGIRLFAKETDRPARIQLVLPKDEREPQTLEEFKRVVGEALGTEIDERVVDRIPLHAAAFVIRWPLLPTEQLPEDFSRILHQEYQRRLFEAWPTMPRAVLGGQSIREAIEADADRILEAEAIYLRFEGMNQGIDFAQLREHAGLPPLEKVSIDASKTHVPLSYVSRLNLDDLDDATLLAIYHRCRFANATRELALVAERLIDRGVTDENTSLGQIYAEWATSAADAEQVEQIIHRARAATGDDSGQWELLALQKFLELGIPSRVDATLRQIRSEFADNSEVAQAVLRILDDYGLVDREKLQQQHAMQSRGDHARVDPPAPPAAAASSKIWTPGGESGEPEKKLWTPS